MGQGLFVLVASQSGCYARRKPIHPSELHTCASGGKESEGFSGLTGGKTGGVKDLTASKTGNMEDIGLGEKTGNPDA